MAEDSSSKNGEMKRVTIRMEAAKVEQLDDLIWENKKAEKLGREATRSGLIRDKIDELIEELEGNSNRAAPPAD
jgi:metal-responsive CopG/Arc/MetJ family transcriptional regulator